MKEFLIKLIEPKTLLTLVAICILLYGLYKGAVSIDEIIRWFGRVVENWQGKIDVDL